MLRCSFDQKTTDTIRYEVNKALNIDFGDYKIQYIAWLNKKYKVKMLIFFSDSNDKYILSIPPDKLEIISSNTSIHVILSDNTKDKILQYVSKWNDTKFRWKIIFMILEKYNLNYNRYHSKNLEIIYYIINLPEELIDYILDF